MQSAVRVRDNPALELAVEAAREKNLGLGVFFGIDTAYPLANRRSWTFLLEGLEEVAASLGERNIPFGIFRGSGASLLEAAPDFFSLVVCDGGVMPHQRAWKSRVQKVLQNGLALVDTETAVPQSLVSTKTEWSAATLRRKLLPLLPYYGTPTGVPKKWIPGAPGTGPEFPPGWEPLDFTARQKIIGAADPLPGPVDLHGGESRALAVLEEFVHYRLGNYAQGRNDPTKDQQSGLSPYLHFGHISPRTIRARILQEEGDENTEAFLEELLVRRDLSFNYLLHHPQAGTYHGLPDWARRTLESHARDPRDYIYTRDQWEAALTHDQAWNAAQTQLVKTGSMAGYMRMYWGKKILEWSAEPREAFETALYLNDKYALDGRDPNSVAGVAWCFGLHDRPWAERKVFGMVRYMNENGLKRKFNLEAYVRRWLPPMAQQDLPGIQ